MRCLLSSALLLCTLLTLPKAWAAEVAAPPPGQVTERLVAQAHPDQSYALFLPPRRDPAQPPPALILLDPRGRALDALHVAMPGAAAHGWIVLSAYGSRSDVPQAATLAALQAMLDELDARYPHDPQRLYLAGMSGTAKTLWSVLPALRGRVAGLIGVCGGRPPELGRLDLAPPAFVGMTGDRDFNYRDMFALDDELEAAGAPHRLQVFTGPHGWPPDAQDFTAAIDWLELMAMRQGHATRDDAWLAAQRADAEAGIAAAPDALERLRRLRATARDFPTPADAGSFAARATDLAAAADTRRLARIDDRLRADERRFAQRYESWSARLRTTMVEGHATTPPSLTEARFELRIGALQRALRSADPREATSAARQLELGYIGASFYLPELLLARGDTARAIDAYQLAQSIFPDRLRAPMGLARAHARLGEIDAAFAALDTAKALVALDRASLEADPDLRRLQGDPRWAALFTRAPAAAAPADEP